MTYISAMYVNYDEFIGIKTKIPKTEICIPVRFRYFKFSFVDTISPGTNILLDKFCPTEISNIQGVKC